MTAFRPPARERNAWVKAIVRPEQAKGMMTGAPDRDTLALNTREVEVDGVRVVESIRRLEAKLASLEAREQPRAGRDDLYAALHSLAARIEALEGKVGR
jgi:hypothetical protein